MVRTRYPGGRHVTRFGSPGSHPHGFCPMPPSYLGLGLGSLHLWLSSHATYKAVMPPGKMRPSCCVRLDPLRRRFLEFTKLDKPYKWTTKTLRSFLEKVAEHLESDTPPEDFWILTEQGTWSEITIESTTTPQEHPPIIGPPPEDEV